MALLDEVQRLDALGLNLLPAKPRGKAPVVKWQDYQHKRSTPQLPAWFRNGRYNVWMATGSISGVVVLDIDNEAAEEFWRGELGDELLDATTVVRTGSGKTHYWFRLAQGDNCPTWSKSPLHDTEERRAFDVRGDGSGVIIPPSIHECGGAYEWVRDLDHLRPLPDELRGGTGSRRARAGVSLAEGEGHAAVRSMLAKHLADRPEEGGRNNWLASVAGHLAARIPWEDGYMALLRMVNETLPLPLDEAEFTKTADSIWRTEQRRDRDLEPSEANGWLASDGTRLLTYCSRGKGEDAEIFAAAWSDFDVRVIGVIEDESERSYQVEIVRGDDRRRDLLEPGTLGRPAELLAWLARHGATVLPPTGEIHRGSPSARLQRYLESQEAPRSQAVHHLGWHDQVGGFVAHEGIITTTGLEPHGGVMPHPKLRNWAPYRYGFVGEDTARKVLAEVLTFHDRTVCAVFGAWWAACLLKAQIMAETALFPFMALEAPSESGKTTGFFSLMMQLNGNTEGHSEYTIPVLRDRASAHRNGIVWVDDMSDASAVLDLLRQATGEGSRAKKGADRHRQETVRLVAPVAISGEGLGALELEKALLDRAIKLEVGSPKSRRSAKDPERPQWDDIKDLMREYNDDLSQLAGTLVQMALAEAGEVASLRDLRQGSGRYADKIAILRLGARVLAKMSGQDWVIGEVDQWAQDAPDIGDENVLTTQILPELLRTWQLPRTAAGHMPAFVDLDEIVWFSEEAVADAWRNRQGSLREKQLGSLPSIRMQRKVLKAETRRKYSILTNRKRGQTDVQRVYYAFDAKTSAAVVGRTGLLGGQAAPGQEQAAPAPLFKK